MTSQIHKYLDDFIDTYFSKGLQQFPMQTLSPDSKIMFARIFQHILSAKEAWTRNQASIVGAPLTIPDKGSFPRGKDFHYIPKEIQVEIENMEKEGIHYSIKINDRVFDIVMICPMDRPSKRQFFRTCIQKIYIWLHVVSQYAPVKCSHHMSVYIYFTPLKKTVPRTNQSKVIKQAHANTAFTTQCMRTTEMYLFREEEWFKVFIHETFHNMGLDFSEFDHTESNSHILTVFPVKSDVRIYETYCEVWALVLNVMFHVALSKKTQTIAKMMDETENLLEKERRFSLFQCAKILDIYGMEYDDLHNRKCEKALHSRTYKYKEETPILSYYILKSIILFYLDDYVRWCMKHNQGSLNFNKNPQTVKENIFRYCQFIGDHYKGVEYIGSLLLMERWFDKNKTRKGAEMETMRMTLL